MNFRNILDIKIGAPARRLANIIAYTILVLQGVLDALDIVNASGEAVTVASAIPLLITALAVSKFGNKKEEN